MQTKDGGKANCKKFLIDGQQRITALMAAIAGKEVLDEDFNRDRIKIAFNPLAKAADISNYTITKMSKGENVTVETLGKICKVLGCGVDDIMEFIPDDAE